MLKDTSMNEFVWYVVPPNTVYGIPVMGAAFVFPYATTLFGGLIVIGAQT